MAAIEAAVSRIRSFVLGAGDFSNDGRCDVVWRDSINRVHIWLVRGELYQRRSTNNRLDRYRRASVISMRQHADLVWHDDQCLWWWIMNTKQVVKASSQAIGAAPPLFTDGCTGRAACASHSDHWPPERVGRPIVFTIKC
jgi:hypothetical protein